MRSYYVLSLTIFLGLFLAGAKPAYPWSDTGHTVVGEVAEQTINPATKDFVRGILGVEPLGIAAVWPDHARDDTVRFSHHNATADDKDKDNHNFDDYHFCDITPGFDYDTSPAKPVKDCYGVITHGATILSDVSGKYTREEKLIALRYLIHVMGDTTQPLHVGNTFDLGGNACLIRPLVATASPMNFHSFWDDNVVVQLGLSYADANAHRPPARFASDYLVNLQRVHPEIFADPAAAKARYASGDLKQWLSDSMQIRDDGVYPDAPGSMQGISPIDQPKHRPYCLWFQDERNNILGAGSPQTTRDIPLSAIPTLDTAYVNRFIGVVEMQLLKGGLRLAKTLDDIAAAAMASPSPVFLVNDAQQELILKTVQDTFRNSPILPDLKR